MIARRKYVLYARPPLLEIPEFAVLEYLFQLTESVIVSSH